MMSVGVAQADVKVSGLVHMSIDNLDRDNAADNGEWFVANNSSYLRIAASEDLGGGMKGIAQLEFAFSNLGTSSTSASDSLETSTGAVNTNRDNFVGLSGGFGELTLGNRNSAVKDVGGIFDLFYREQLGEMRSLSHQGWFDARVANAIHYTSPSMGGWSVKAQYGTEDDFGNDNTSMWINVMGKIGPVKVGAAYGSSDLSPTTDTDGFRLAASWDIGALTLRAFWQSQSDQGGVNGRDRDAYGAGVGFKMGNSMLKAQYVKADSQDGVATDNGADQVSVGFDHNLSKTTVVYATYAKTSNDAAGTFGIGGNGHGEAAIPGAGADASGFSFGIRKSF